MSRANSLTEGQAFTRTRGVVAEQEMEHGDCSSPIAELLGLSAIVEFEKLKMYGLHDQSFQRYSQRTDAHGALFAWTCLRDLASGSMSRWADRAESDPCSSSL